METRRHESAGSQSRAAWTLIGVCIREEAPGLQLVSQYERTTKTMFTRIAVTTLIALAAVTSGQAAPRQGYTPHRTMRHQQEKRTFHLTVAGRPSSTSLPVTGIDGVQRVVFSRGSALVRDCEGEGKTRSLVVLKKGDQIHVNGVRRGDTILAYGAADKLDPAERRR
jgi:hypothetical protein